MLSHLSTVLLHVVSLLYPNMTLRRVGDCYFVLVQKTAIQVTTTKAFFLFILGLNSQPVPPPPRSQPRASSQPPPISKSVQFDLNPQSFSSDSLDPVSTSPENPPKSRRKPSGIRPRSNSNSNHNRVSAPAPIANSRSHRYNRRRRAAHTNNSRSPSPAHSDATLDLPPRFDKYGRPIAQTGEDPLADAVDGLLAGTGVAGKFLGKLAAGLGGR